MVRIGIIGGAGYTAGELIRILINHQDVEIAFVQSTSNAGKALWEVHEGLFGETDLRFCDSFDLEDVDVLFMCSSHGASREFWASHPRAAGLKVIDLAQDFRDGSCGYIYGLPECNREQILGADSVANPGCFATAVQLSLLPLAAVGILPQQVDVTAITGSTGAGVKPGPTTHFSWRSNNVSAYKVLTHQHVPEIVRTLTRLQSSACHPEQSEGSSPRINLIPLRGGFARGIFAVSQLSCPLEAAEVRKLYEDYYADAPFTFVAPGEIDLKQVTGTNKCLIQLEQQGSHLVVCAAIDNLIKGASGQAVQNMNLMCGLPEDTGLHLKATAF